MKLYSFSGSCGLASNIALNWAGADYALEMIDKTDLDKPEMLRMNPNHQVPILDVDGWVLTENAAILNFIADSHPASGLGGDGTPRGRAEVNRWLAMVNSDVHPAFKPLFGATAYLEDAATIEKTQTHARSVLRRHFEILDRQLAGRDYIAGARSIADPYLFVVVTWTHFVKVDLDGLDNIKAFEKRMRADPGVKAALKAQRLDKDA